MCNHERIKSVNCEIFCAICGEKLPIDFLVGKDRIKAQGTEKPAETAQETPKKTTRKKVK